MQNLICKYVPHQKLRSTYGAPRQQDKLFDGLIEGEFGLLKEPQGVGSESGQVQGHFSAIYFRTDVWRMFFLRVA